MKQVSKRQNSVRQTEPKKASSLPALTVTEDDDDLSKGYKEQHFINTRKNLVSHYFELPSFFRRTGNTKEEIIDWSHCPFKKRVQSQKKTHKNTQNLGQIVTLSINFKHELLTAIEKTLGFLRRTLKIVYRLFFLQNIKSKLPNQKVGSKPFFTSQGDQTNDRNEMSAKF